MKLTAFKSATIGAMTIMAGPCVAQEAMIEVNYGYLPVPTMPLFAAEAHGLFDDFGVDVNLIKFTSGPAQFQSLQAGSIDLAQGALAAFYMASTRGLEAKWVYNIGDASAISGLVLSEGNSLESYADLAGQSITAPPGSILHLFHVSQAMDAEVDFDQVDFVPLPPPQAVSAIQNGNVDAAWLWEPLLSIAEANGAVQVRNASEIGLHDVFGLATGADWVESEEGRDAVARVSRALTAGIEAYEQDPGPTLSKIEEMTGIKPELAQSIIARTNWATVTDQVAESNVFSLTGPEGSGAIIDWVDDRALAAGLINSSGAGADFLDPRSATMAAQ
ncbi:ABC-type nitrate/sulfonate/bicarbonate transport system substrate-binding protein [Primorskyibacter sedentarius]|uniref:ABC-type nitrate/sulfonate/bicarbonate transport system substrate-binding protein n=1 Tax=Primorskyibacter sedentarius TaxID=745311 RepID=A0A4R3J0F2_9RHOB|nr:NrtA/SsuA/CpmA family ABC transporter substrate-binding protein [Primorskyibacter sedentarius]TCS57239.1 ABC-type nitrate/sulfonate/bicarbonate transport system substrate-binding protein [Primorskyibacter sedentarius]